MLKNSCMLLFKYILCRSRRLPGGSFQFTRQRVTMACPVEPPKEVRGMTVWNKEAFSTSSSFPCLRIKVESINSLKSALDKYTARIINFKNLQDDLDGRKIVILNPLLVKSFGDLSDIHETLQQNHVEKKDYLDKMFELNSDNWKPAEKLKYILPENEEGVTAHSRVGHIIHLNLKDHMLPYKHVIGQVMLETKNIRTVVTKTSNIDNTFRNFELEVLAGEKDFQVDVKENGVGFSFDFSKVYWNPRLSTEHERIVKSLKHKSILFDACAGVGPFSIPAAKTCRVFANDLNPESYRWLKYNAEKNKIRTDRISCFNLDARDFIRQVFVSTLKLVVKSPKGAEVEGEEWFPYGLDSDLHITMNLPALAITFIDVFQGLLSEHPDLDIVNLPLPTIHVYTFSKAEDTVKDVRMRLDEHLGTSLDDKDIVEIAFVRNVAPNKDMMRATFKMPRHILFHKVAKRKLEDSEENSEKDDQENCKKSKD